MPTSFTKLKRIVATLLLAAMPAALLPASAFASSHMDAPLITLDPAANTTDVYAFVDQEGNAEVLGSCAWCVPAPGAGNWSKQVQLRR
jgi:hypothetical protein